MSGLQKKIIPPVYALQAFGIFFLACYLLSRPLLDEDSSWHLAAGDYMRATLSLLRINLWSFAAPDQPWHNWAWGWDVLISFLLDKTGAKGLFIFLCTCYGLIGATLALHLRQRQVPRNVFFAVITLALLMCLSYQWARPQTFSYLMIVLFHMALHLSRKGNHNIRMMMLGLPLLMALWANMHGGFIAAFFIYAAYGIEALVSRQYAWFKMLLISGILCALATLLNPYGWKIWLSIYENQTSVITPYIDEWKPYTLLTLPGADIFIFLLIVATDFRDRQLPLADKLSCIFWTAMALLSKRHFVIAVLVSAPTIAAGLKKWTKNTRAQQPLNTRKSPKVALLTACMVILLSVAPIHKIIRHDLLLGNAALPLNAFAFIREHYPHKKFMNEYRWGGYIIFFNKQRTPIFADDRTRTAYPESMMQEMVRIMQGDDAAFLEAVKKYHADGVILARTSPFIAQHPIPAAWKLVFQDKLAAIYLIER